jgi:hypothetical protein
VLDRQKVIAAFERKRRQFEHFTVEQARDLAYIRAQLAAFARRDSSAILDELDRAGVEWPGALPTVELDAAANLCIPFRQAWGSHQEARAWALATLRDRPVMAVDGSQITPTKDMSLPVGAIQIGWFVNYHNAGGRYVKDVEIEVLAPHELLGEDDDAESGDATFPNWRVNQERFVRECDRLCALMVEFAPTADADKPLCFFDGSFIISFAGQMRPERAAAYVRAVDRLLVCSQETRVPVVAFVDTSYSRDVVGLIQTLASDGREIRSSDAALFAPQLLRWGDRTPLFLCARADGLSADDRAGFYKNVAFTYLSLVRDRSPARLEMPRWVLDAGRAEEVLDLVRAECVVGTGYPYAIETADALAVISQPDRARFYALFEQFASRSGLRLTRARKASSKLARR